MACAALCDLLADAPTIEHWYDGDDAALVLFRATRDALRCSVLLKDRYLSVSLDDAALEDLRVRVLHLDYDADDEDASYAEDLAGALRNSPKVSPVPAASEAGDWRPTVTLEFDLEGFEAPVLGEIALTDCAAIAAMDPVAPLLADLVAHFRPRGGAAEDAAPATLPPVGGGFRHTNRSAARPAKKARR